MWVIKLLEKIFNTSWLPTVRNYPTSLYLINWKLINVVGSILYASYFGSRTCSKLFKSSHLHHCLRSVTMNFSIWLVMGVDRGELNGIFYLTCNISFKVCCCYGMEKWLSLPDRRVDETKTRESEDRFYEYSGWCLFKCWIIFVVYPDLYYDSTTLCR